MAYGVPTQLSVTPIRQQWVSLTRDTAELIKGMRRSSPIKVYVLFLVSSSLWLAQGQWGIGALILISSGASLAHHFSKREDPIYGYFANWLRRLTWLLISTISIPTMGDVEFYAFLALTIITMQTIDLGTDPNMKRDWTTFALICESLIQIIGAIALL